MKHVIYCQLSVIFLISQISVIFSYLYFCMLLFISSLHFVLSVVLKLPEMWTAAFCKRPHGLFTSSSLMFKSVFVSYSSNGTRQFSTTLPQYQANMEKFALSKKYHGLEKNVWVEFVKLALEYKPLNLGQGLPDDLVPHYVLQSLSGM